MLSATELAALFILAAAARLLIVKLYAWAADDIRKRNDARHAQWIEARYPATNMSQAELDALAAERWD